VRRLRPLSEVECYLRCYGAGGGDIRVVQVEAARRRARPRLSGEEVRRLFAERLDAREPEAA
jgi:hypothetical protein